MIVVFLHDSFYFHEVGRNICSISDSSTLGLLSFVLGRSTQMLVNFVGFFKDPTFFLLVLRDSSLQSLCGHCFLSVLCMAAM